MTPYAAHGHPTATRRSARYAGGAARERHVPRTGIPTRSCVRHASARRRWTVDVTVTLSCEDAEHVRKLLRLCRGGDCETCDRVVDLIDAPVPEPPTSLGDHSRPGSGYGDVCDDCAGQRSEPAPTPITLCATCVNVPMIEQVPSEGVALQCPACGGVQWRPFTT